MKKYIIPLLLTALAAAALLALPASAAVRFADGYVKISEGSDVAQPSEGTPVLPFGTDFLSSGDADAPVRLDDGSVAVSFGGNGAVPKKGDDPAPKSAVVYTSGSYDLSAWDAAAVNVYVSFSSGDVPETVFVTFSLNAGTDSLRFREEVTPGRTCGIRFDLSSLRNRSAVKRVAATLEWDGAGSGEAVFSRMHGIAGSDFSALSAMCSDSVRSFGGTAEFADGTVTVRPGGGEAELLFRVDRGSLPQGGAKDGETPVTYAALTVTATGGEIYADFSKRGDPEGEDELQPLTAWPGTHTYAFRFTSSVPDVVRIGFRGRDGEDFTCEGLRFIRAGTVDRSVDEAGCTVDCVLSDGTLRVDGKLKKSSAALYIGKKIGLFACDVTGGDAVLIASGRAGSSFSFSVPESSLPKGGRESYFWVSLLDGDSEDVRLSEKKFLSTASVSEGDAAVYGFYGAEPAGVFEAALNRAIVDIDLDELTGTGSGLPSGLTAIRNSETYYLNDEYVRRIDEDMKFYSAAGVGVYLRFIADDPEKLFFSDGEEDGDGGMGLYLAAVSFFCERYENVPTVIIPDVSDAEDPWGSAGRAALLARMTYGAGADASKSFIVTVPVDGGADGELFISLFAEAMAREGRMRWSLLCLTSEPSFDSVDVSVGAARANGSAAPYFSAVLWTPGEIGEDDAAEGFLSLCERARAAGSRAVIMAAPGSARDGLADYTKFRVPGIAGRGVFEREIRSAEEVSPSVTASGVLWDFSGSYSTEGWVSGTGIGFCGTAFKSGRSGDRVLRFTLDRESSHGILLKTFPDGLSISRYPLVRFDFSVESDDEAYVTFTFGGEEGRQEFTAACPAGRSERSVVCDVGSAAADIGYVSILVRSEGAVTVDLSRVTVNTSAEGEKGEFLVDTDGSGKEGDGLFDGKNRGAIMAVIAVSALVFLWLAIHSFRSDRDASLRRKNRESKQDVRINRTVYK